MPLLLWAWRDKNTHTHTRADAHTHSYGHTNHNSDPYCLYYHPLPPAWPRRSAYTRFGLKQVCHHLTHFGLFSCQQSAVVCRQRSSGLQFQFYSPAHDHDCTSGLEGHYLSTHTHHIRKTHGKKGISLSSHREL